MKFITYVCIISGLIAGQTYASEQQKKFTWHDVRFSPDPKALLMSRLTLANNANNYFAFKHAYDEAEVSGYLDEFINMRDDNNNTLLLGATAAGNINIFDLILRSKANVNYQGRLNWTALHQAATLNQNKMIEKLLAARADASIRGDGNLTPLMIAAQRNLDIASMLAKVSDKDTLDATTTLPKVEGSTALILATRNLKFDIAQVLLNAKADATITDKDGKDALYYAQKYKAPKALTDRLREIARKNPSKVQAQRQTRRLKIKIQTPHQNDHDTAEKARQAEEATKKKDDEARARKAQQDDLALKKQQEDEAQEKQRQKKQAEIDAAQAQAEAAAAKKAREDRKAQKDKERETARKANEEQERKATIQKLVRFVDRRQEKYAFDCWKDFTKKSADKEITTQRQTSSLTSAPQPKQSKKQAQQDAARITREKLELQKKIRQKQQEEIEQNNEKIRQTLAAKKAAEEAAAKRAREIEQLQRLMQITDYADSITAQLVAGTKRSPLPARRSERFIDPDLGAQFLFDCWQLNLPANGETLRLWLDRRKRLQGQQ